MGFDLDSKILGVYRADKMEIMKTMYISKYTIDAFDSAHSVTSSIDMKTQKLTVTGVNVSAVKGKVYYLVIGRRIPKNSTGTKLRRRRLTQKRRLTAKRR